MFNKWLQKQWNGITKFSNKNVRHSWCIRSIFVPKSSDGLAASVAWHSLELHISTYANAIKKRDMEEQAQLLRRYKSTNVPCTSRGTMPREKKLLGLAAAGTGVLVGVYYAASPWLTVNKLKQAFEKKDTRQIEKIVDFTELREDFKEVAKAAILQKAATELEGNPFTALGIMMANAFIDPLLDQVISPAGLQALLSTGEMSVQPNDDLIDNNSWSSKESTTEDFQPSPDLSKMSYTDLNEFKIELSNKKVIAEPVSLFMERERFADWKVTGIEIPQSVFNSIY